MNLYSKLCLTCLMLIGASALAESPFVPLTDDLIPAGTDYHLVQPAVTDPNQLAGKRVAILASHGVEETEIQFPYEYLKSRGAKVDILVPWWTAKGVVTSNYVKNTGFAKAQGTFRTGEKYDLIILTGGAWNGQVELGDADLKALVYRHYVTEQKPLAAICKGTEVLIHIKSRDGQGHEDVDGPSIIRGMKVAGPDYEKENLKNAGFLYQDNTKAVVSGRLLTGVDPTGLVEFVSRIPSLLDGKCGSSLM